MALRTNDSLVREIIETDANLTLSGFIRAANGLTNWVASQDSDNELSSDDLQSIETWLAAHFYAHRDQLYQSKSTDKASATFQGRTDMGLASTQYGQTAMMLDITGALTRRNSEMEKGGPAIIRTEWLGTGFTGEEL